MPLSQIYSLEFRIQVKEAVGSGKERVADEGWREQAMTVNNWYDGIIYESGQGWVSLDYLSAEEKEHPSEKSLAVIADGPVAVFVTDANGERLNIVGRKKSQVLGTGAVYRPGEQTRPAIIFPDSSPVELTIEENGKPVRQVQITSLPASF